MQTSTRLGLAYIQPQQAQKHVTANESFRRLDAAVQLSVKSSTTTAQPGAPADSDCYIIPAGASGAAWAAMTPGAIAAYQDGAWAQLAPGHGWRAFVQDIGEGLVFDGGWKRPARLGVNAGPDATNRLTVKSDAVLFAHDSVTPGNGDSIVKIDKATAGDTAGIALSAGLSARAEFGLRGNDDLSLRVSANGSTWTEALFIDKDNGYAGLGTLTPEATLSIERRGGIAGIVLSEHQEHGSAPNISQRKARGSTTTPAAVLNGDAFMAFSGLGYTTSGFVQSANFRAVVDGAPAGAIVPGRFEWLLMNTAGAFAERMRLTSAGYLGIGVAAPICSLDVEGPVKVKSYAKAALPAATAGAGQIIYVSDEAGGATIAFSDGASWRRVADRAVVS